jgi:hypothetical protein
METNNNINNEMNNETFINKAGKIAFNAVDKAAGASCGLLSIVGSLIMGALKSATYFVIGGALIFGSVIALSPKPTALERERLENLIVIDKREVQKKDERISKLENEGTTSRVIRKLRGKPLE